MGNGFLILHEMTFQKQNSLFAPTLCDVRDETASVTAPFNVRTKGTLCAGR